MPSAPARTRPPGLLKRRAKPVPNNAGRRMRSPSLPVNVELLYTLALERVAHRLSLVIHKVIGPHVAEFAAPVERMDAKPSPKSMEEEAAIQGLTSKQARLLLSQMRAAHAAVKGAIDEDESEILKEAFGASKRVLAHSKHEFRRLKIDVRKEPLLEPLMDGWRHDSVALIKNMGEVHLDKIEKILREGYGRRAESLEDDIFDVLGVAGGRKYKPGQMARRAKLIARDQVLSLNAKITRYRQRAAGINAYIWTTSQDERVRPEHEALEGERFSWDGEGDPEEGHPGEAINCLPAGAKITRAHDVLRVFRRWYRGELTTLITDSGEAVECTPNHPILTASGWKPAHALEIGDHLFEARQHRARALAKLDVEDRDPSIADVFDVLSLVGDLHRVAGSGAQFHGDGAVDEQVDVVDPNGGLFLHLEATEAKRLCEFIFTDPDRATTRSRAFELALHAVGFPTDRVVRCLSERLAIFEARRLHAFDHGSAASTQFNARALQEVRDRLTWDPVALGQELDRGALSIDVEAFLLREAFRIVRGAVVTEGLHAPSSECLGDIVRMASQTGRDLSEEHPLFEKPLCIVEKRSRQFEGHVFNLETRSGWYGADTVLQSNCRCVAYPILANEFLD